LRSHRIIRSADDTGCVAVYRRSVAASLSRLRGLRPSPHLVDGSLAALLTAVAELEIWLAERERVVVAREAVGEERARIARELHDAIAHDVSLMVVQAGAERRVLDPQNGSTRELLETVEQIGRSSLDEMRRLVGMLRGDEDDPLSPQPGLRDRSSRRR
jgi:signal transduction histidine kinase